MDPDDMLALLAWGARVALVAAAVAVLVWWWKG